MNQIADERLMTIAELSTMLGVPIDTLYGWRHRGEGNKGYRVRARSIRTSTRTAVSPAKPRFDLTGLLTPELSGQVDGVTEEADQLVVAGHLASRSQVNVRRCPDPSWRAALRPVFEGSLPEQAPVSVSLDIRV